MPSRYPFRLLTVHYGLYQLSFALGGGFVGAYMLKLGFSLTAALVLYAALLVTRFALRFLALGVVRRLGFRRAMMTGAILGALQFVPLMLADSPPWFLAWLLVISLAESIYWPIYHSAAAVLGGESRGRELGIRTAVSAGVNVLGPLAGGVLLSRFEPVVDFGVAIALAMLSVLPLLWLHEIPAGAMPDLRQSVRTADRRAVVAFAADGWMASGLAMAWPMVLFLALGSQFEAFGAANALAGLVGAATGIICGRAVDRGQRDRYLVAVCAALAVSFALRACAGWSPHAATIANATGAAVMGLYVPVLMSVIYDRAKGSGQAYSFHVSAEAGWDAGAAAGCITAAVLAWAVKLPSLAVLPSALGILGLYWSVRSKSAKLPKPLQIPNPAMRHAG